MRRIIIQALEPQFVDGAYEVERHCLAESWSREAIADFVKKKDAVYFVSTYDNFVFGIAGMYIVAGEGQIINVAVKAEYRRNGIGRMLFGKLIKEGQKQGAEFFSLEVNCFNDAAIKLYENFGFVKTGMRKGFLEKDKVFIMQKKIN